MPKRRYFVGKNYRVYSFSGTIHPGDTPFTSKGDIELLPASLGMKEIMPPVPRDYPRLRLWLTKAGEVYIAEMAARRNETDRDISFRTPVFHMGATFLTPGGEYYQADTPQTPDDIEVPMRPDPFHDWDGEKYVLNLERFLQEKVRPERNRLLCATDWTDLPNAPLTTEQKAAWQAYRQALRDLPTNTTDERPPWPTPPAAIPGEGGEGV